MKKYSAALILPILLLLIPIIAPSFAAAAEETVCLQCHGGQTGHLGEPVPLWRESVHQANGISCHHCHGGDPTDFAMAMRPERGFIGVPADNDIPAFCGRCHVGVLEDYQASAHGRALGSGGPQCVTCHDNHRVLRASIDLINPQDCSRCHDYGRAEELRQAVSGTDALITGLENDLAELHRLGFDTKPMSGTVFSLRNDFHRLFHSVDVEKVRSKTAVFAQDLDKVEKEVAAIQSDLGKRKLWGGAMVVLLVLAGLYALLIHKSYQEETGED
ncbi:MAG: cytochrome C [Desulfuromonadaceae bacterium GWC2_58_13]|nr:MAG: cytochrome C [Desulfuromonadaceae bacterium GWC2_58_13]